MKTGPTLRQLADRISKHLKRFEADKTGINKPDKPRGLQDYYNAWAGVAGRYVRVQYISYQGGRNITKAEAEHYLALLDSGYVGRHWEALREHPLPARPDAPLPSEGKPV